MLKILKHVFFVMAIALVAGSYSGAYLGDRINVNGISLSTDSSASATDVRLNEVFANPVNDPPGSSNESNGEWLELYNNGYWSWDVNGWRLVDAANNSMIIDATKTGGLTVVPAHGWLMVSRNGDPNFSLNNGTETVYLYNGGMLVDSFHYTATTETKSWGRKPDGIGTWFSDLMPTPGGTNGL